jgi:hypothetical protein
MTPIDGASPPFDSNTNERPHSVFATAWHQDLHKMIDGPIKGAATECRPDNLISSRERQRGDA